MTITATQRERRGGHLGSTDMAAILGESSYASKYDIYAEKAGKLDDSKRPKETDAMSAGNFFEDGVLAQATVELGPLIRNQYRSAPELYLGANIDALVVATKKPVEAKTSGMFGPVMGNWGEAGTNTVPPHVLIQCHVHMLVTKQDHCHVPAFLGGRGFVMYEIPRNNQLAEHIALEAVKFWEDHVLADIPPEDSLPSEQTIKLTRRVPEKVIQIEEDFWLKEWLHAKDVVKSYESVAKTAKANLARLLGDAEAAEFPDGTAITYYEQSRKGHVVEPSTPRVLLHKKKGL